jgi:hypothetical protein
MVLRQAMIGGVLISLLEGVALSLGGTAPSLPPISEAFELAPDLPKLSKPEPRPQSQPQDDRNFSIEEAIKKRATPQQWEYVQKNYATLHKNPLPPIGPNDQIQSDSFISKFTNIFKSKNKENT